MSNGAAQLAKGILVLGVTPIACVWLWAARRRFVRGARVLNEAERGLLGPHFSEELLSGVRVAVVGRIELPLTGMAALVTGVSNPMHSPGGIALGRLVVIASGNRRGERKEARFRSTLFHEMVHVAQYREMGTFGFLRRYLGAVIRDGCAYAEIPLEVQAYGLQERFEKGELEGGQVEREVRELGRDRG